MSNPSAPSTPRYDLERARDAYHSALMRRHDVRVRQPGASVGENAGSLARRELARVILRMAADHA
jgi:hypothetical protein